MCRDGRITDAMSIIAMTWAAMDRAAARRPAIGAPSR